MGNFSQDLVELSSEPQPRLSTPYQGLYLVLPDLSRLDLKNQAVYGSSFAKPTHTHCQCWLWIALHGIGIGDLIFSYREF